MDLDPLSIVTPARVKVLLLPIGDHVKQSRFASFAERLQQVNVVRLGDVSPDSRPHRTMFSPLAFPEGLVLYDLSLTLPPPSHLELSPFELYREVLAVIGIVDGRQLEAEGGQYASSEEGGRGMAIRERRTFQENTLESLSLSLDGMRRDFPKSILHQILVFDTEASNLPNGVSSVPSPERSRTTTVKTVMCDLTSKLLAEMTTYAKSLQAMPSPDTPRVLSGSAAPGGTVSALPAHMIGLLRPGSAAESARSFSPAEQRPEPSHRMSMPAILPSDAGPRTSTPNSRATSPPSGARAPPTSFNEMNGPSAFHSPPKSSGHSTSRTASRDRVSINGFGSGSLGERERNKGKGRIGVVVGAMYLLAGRWPDAIKELVHSATIARGSSDYVWHAKAMDYVLVCLLMYAWAGMDFHIPEVLFPSTEKSSSSSKSSSHAQSSSLPDFTTRKSLDPASRVATLRSLTSVLPDLTNNILNLYSRAWTFTDEKLPPLAFSQSAIRFAKLLSAIHLSHGILDDGLLGHLVLNTTVAPIRSLPPETAPFLTRTELVNLLFRAYPQPLSESAHSIADHIAILAAIASVLSKLGYHRKKALILKELTSYLLPALVQARKDGAAEMGVHPAASLATLNATIRAIPARSAGSARDDSEEGVQHLLSLLCQAYGIRPHEPIASPSTNAASTKKEGVDVPISSTPAQISETIVARALKQVSSKACGSQDLKIDILRSCVNLCEALPDLGGALRYSAELLRIGGSGIAPGPDNSDGLPELPVEEQVRLANNISRTLSAARQLGLAHPEAEYWDDFLVRGIENMETSPSKRMLAHAKLELELVETIEAKKEKNPFIYNPFLKPKASSGTRPVLIAQEEAFFRVTMQNLYDMDIVIERIKLSANGVPFKSSPQATLIGPYRTQTILLSGTPQSAGSMTIVGCIAKIKGCRERDFPTFSEPWSLKVDVKGRHLQLKDKPRSAVHIAESGKDKVAHISKGPTAAALAVNVIGAQPNIVMKSISAPQSAVMLLEGEAKMFILTLRNTSCTTLVDLLLVSFDDSAAARRQSALTNKELSPLDLYELELDTAHKQPFRWLRKEHDPNLEIRPSEEICLEIEVLGKPGLSHGTVQVDYGHLGIPKADIKDRFFTRQLVIPLTVTVNASIDVVRNDFVSLPGGLLRPELQPQPQGDEKIRDCNQTTAISDTASTSNSYLQSLLGRISSSSSMPYCLLLLDLRNSSPTTLNITISILDLTLSQEPFSQTQTLNPAITTRIPLPIPRIYLPDAHAPIPSLNPANKRQFVVSTTKSSPEAERTMREAFWYREALLSRLEATWKDEGTGRTGNIALRSLRLTPHMMSALKLPDLSISLSITSTEPNTPVTQVSHSTFEVPTAFFLTLHTTLYNRSATPIRPLLRLQPTLAKQSPNIALDLSKKLLVNGVLQRALPALEPSETRVVETGFCVLCSGVYEWGATVEEVSASKAGKEGHRARAATGNVDLDSLGPGGRRIWNAEEVCTIVARKDTTESRKDEAVEV